MVEGTELTYSNCIKIWEKSLSEVKYAWQQLLDYLMNFKSLNVEKQGKTSPTNAPKFNQLSQQTNHLVLKEQDKPLIILSRIGIKTTIKKCMLDNNSKTNKRILGL